MASLTPSKKNIVWPVADHGIHVTIDPDAQHLGDVRWAPYHTVHIPYEPLATPRIETDSEGIRWPNAEDLQPRLAIKWNHSDDFRTWDVELRHGVKSHFGNELTSADIKWAWDRVFALKGVGLWRTRRLGGLDTSDNVVVTGKYTLQFKLPNPNPEFPQYWVFATNNVYDATEAQKHATANDPWAQEWLAKHVAGFGAFSIDEWNNDILSFKSRDEYWSGKPGIDSIVQVGIEHRAAGLRMLDKGDANMLLGLYPEELARYEGRPDFTTYRVRANHSTLEFNWLEAPFDDQKVRQAVSYAVPYAKILDQVYMGYAKMNKSPISNVSKFYTEEYWHYDTNIETARQLMKESGHPDGFDTELYLLPSNESLRFGEILKAALKPIGINVELRLVGRTKFGQKVPMWFKEECGHALYEPMYDLGHDYDPPLGMWAGRNIRDRLWTDRLREIRQAEAPQQEQLYKNIQRDILEAAPAVHIAEIQTGWAFRGEIDPWVVGPYCLTTNTTVWSAHRQIMPYW